MSPHPPLLRLTGVTVAGAMAALLLSTPAHAEDPPEHIEDERTRPVFDYAEAIYEEIDIQTEADSDGDGTPDTVRLRLLRPAETEDGLQVPTIIQPSPYWAGLNDLEFYDVDLDDEGAGTVPPPGQAGPPPGDKEHGDDVQLLAAPQAPQIRELSGYYDNYFLPRGYAVAELDSLGSGEATGCPTSGGHNETLGVKAAVDWLNGRTTGRDPDGDETEARDWSTGSVAMAGISYNGTLPIAAATTGVEGLETIVPQGAISSWYDYFRHNGGVVAPGGFQGEDADVLARAVNTRADAETCEPALEGVTEGQDRDTGDYNEFWDERNYRNDVGDITASVFLAHGLNDWNVKTDQGLQLWQHLGEHGVQRKMWLFQPGHINPFNLRIEEWLDQLHRWFDHELYGLDNGIMDEPAVDFQQPDLSWSAEEHWPPQDTEEVRLHLNARDDTAHGALETRPDPQGRVVESFTDAGRTVDADTLVADPGASGENALAYLTEELESDVRLSGMPEVRLRAAMDGASPYLTALLVDYGTAERPGAAVAATDDEVCYGEGLDGPACAVRTEPVLEEADHRIVTRGSLDARNRHSLWEGRPVVAERMYHYSWPLLGQDYVFPAGHRIGVVIISTDHDFTLRYPAGTEVALRTGTAQVTLPVSGADGLG
jgi:X-Pro dipeptidyl-peptidase